MTLSEAAKLSKESKKRWEAKMEEFAQRFRPKVIRQYEDQGHLVTVYQTAFAEGANEC